MVSTVPVDAPAGGPAPGQSELMGAQHSHLHLGKGHFPVAYPIAVMANL